MFLSWQARFIKDFANFELLDSDDGLVKSVLEITLEFFLPKKKCINEVFSALLVLDESLLCSFLHDFNASLSGCIGLYAAGFIDLTEQEESLISVHLKLLFPEFFLGIETSKGSFDDEVNLVRELVCLEDGGCI
jgi:hypothetical protein